MGYSAICFATASPDRGRKSGIERIHVPGGDGKCCEFELAERIRIIEGDASESLKQLAASLKDVIPKALILCFIDAAKSVYKDFWNACIPLCRKGAVVISDNVLLKARTASDEYITKRRQKTSVRHMREYLNYITGSKEAHTAVLSVGDGVAVSVLKEK